MNDSPRPTQQASYSTTRKGGAQAMTNSRRMKQASSFRMVLFIFVFTALAGLSGCGTSLLAGPSELDVVSQDDASKRLRGNFDSAYYVYNSDESVTVVLIEGPEDEPVQAATIRLMWNPKAGFTPINAEATNATIQYIVFAERASGDGVFREVGIYSGAGFLFLESDPGEDVLTGSLWQADVLLADRSDNFRDLLGQSNLTGSFSAELDHTKVAELLNKLNQRVTERLGYPRLVDQHPGFNAHASQY